MDERQVERIPLTKDPSLASTFCGIRRELCAPVVLIRRIGTAASASRQHSGAVLCTEVNGFQKITECIQSLPMKTRHTLNFGEHRNFDDDYKSNSEPSLLRLLHSLHCNVSTQGAVY